MSAYGFKAQFAAAVSSGKKRQTIRALRKKGRHALPGEAMQLYTGMRTKDCRKLLDPDPVCASVDPISILLCVDGVQVFLNEEQLGPRELTRLALADGFGGPLEFLTFFRETHGLPFNGVLIKWRPGIS